MLVISLRSLIQEATASADEQHLSGHIRDPEALFRSDSMQALEDRHSGPFGFLAFDPHADKAIADYLLQGTLAVDSGEQLLILFITSEATSAVSLTRYSLCEWLEVEKAEQPAYELVRNLFQSKQVPPLPGVAFFASLQGKREVIYAGLAEFADAPAVRARLRSLFSQADHAWSSASSQRDAFISKLAVALMRSNIAFERTGRISMHEWFVSAYKFLGRHKADLVSIVKLGTTLSGLP